MKHAAALAVMLCAAPAWATCPDTLAVNTFADTTTDSTCAATCSLRTALALAASTCAGVPITVPAGTYPTTSTLTVTGTVNVIGAGAAQTVIDAGGTVQALLVSGTLTLSGVSVLHGKATGRGGAAKVTGTLNASDVIFANNAASAEGGGLAVESGGTVSCTACMASGNSADSGGGVVVAGTLTWTDGSISGNTAAKSGGGVSGEAGSMSFTRALVSANTATAGGGISASNAVTLQASTVADNHATAGDGGGIAQLASTLALQNVTVSGNVASGAGGGVKVAALTTDTWQGVTVSANQAASGGGIAMTATAGASLSGVLASGNTAATDADCAAAPTLVSAGHNLIAGSGSPGGCHITPAASDVTGDAKLLSLSDNSGPVPTHAIAAGSAAIDAGPTGLETDARGVARPQGVAADIGAFERGAATMSLSGASVPTTAAAGSTALHMYRVTNLGPTPAVQVSATVSGPVLAASGSGTTACAASLCALGAIAVGESATVTLLVSGTLASSLVVHADNAPDAALQLATTVTPSADLAVQALPVSSTVDLGAQTEVAIVVHNAGPSDVQTVTLTVTPGSETFLVPAPAAPVTCAIALGVATCALGALAAGGSQSVTVAMSASALGQLTFHAEAASEIADPNAANNSVDQSISVSGVDTSTSAPTSSASGVTNTGSSGSKSGCHAVPVAWWALSLAVWWRRPRRSSSRR